MFGLETEDMLPRTAPKPSVGPQEPPPPVKPTVPEVSLLLNQPAATNNVENNAEPKPVLKQTYAKWKKQVLPKVSFPPECGSDVTACCSSSSSRSGFSASSESYTPLYPLRSVTVHANIQQPHEPPVFTCMDYAAPPPPQQQQHQPQYQQRRSLESIYGSSNTNINALQYPNNTAPNYVQMPHHTPTMFPSTSQQSSPLFTAQTQQQQQHRHSLDALTQQQLMLSLPNSARSSNDVLTICAGTQTEPCQGSVTTAAAELPNKQDMQQLVAVVQQLYSMQERMYEMCSHIMQQQQQLLQNAKEPSAQVQHAATQCEEGSRAAPHTGTSPLKDVMPSTPTAATTACLRTQALNNAQQQAEQLQFRSPAGNTRPLMPNAYQQPTSPVTFELQRTPSDKSLAMNELARKYLPNDKLTELMSDLQLSNTPSTPQQQQQTSRVGPAAGLSTPNDEFYGSYRATTPAATQPPTPATTQQRRNEHFAADDQTRTPCDISDASYMYLKKYRLLPEEQQHKELRHANNTSLYAARHEQDESSLNLEGIRGQPKFL